ncbi:coiled-coil domain-containing protein 103 isoform X1 [Neodiprion virginianus]|uniref:coiled-coil domain-containing protein 103 isoform X1 n=1 Tax=Neodiprion virginianus TaxID=2961670 RepID=UPI001EE6DC86|nr:coiled-coil domain-containing protein 103 isoform X1 [Neodiprion virginianus]XP_046611988.1 coiled-coil domain-containing protein 103 isoform X1 [Neodiprion virginianus]
MSILEQPIDYEALEVELHDAVKADALYKLQNDAKIRAVEQRVPTYDQFRDMVSAAHLKPVERSDTQPKLGVRWNSVASCTTPKTQLPHCFYTLTKSMSQKPADSFYTNKEKAEDTTIIQNVQAPKSTEEFLQTWKKITDHKKRFEYLLTIKPVVFIEIFRPEVPLGVLGEIMEACLRNLPEGDDVDTVIDVLTALSHCNRFQLSVNFMTQEEKDVSKQLFRRLLARGKAGDGAAEVTVDMLRKRYQIKFD